MAPEINTDVNESAEINIEVENIMIELESKETSSSSSMEVSADIIEIDSEEVDNIDKPNLLQKVEAWYQINCLY